MTFNVTSATATIGLPSSHAHAAGMRIIPYTVNEPAAWERLIEWGVDGITTDYPDRLLAWLAERGLCLL